MTNTQEVDTILDVMYPGKFLQNKKFTFKVQLIHSNAKLPTRANQTDAGWDVYAIGPDSIEIPPGEQILLPTGLVIECPPGKYIRARPRSGNAVKYYLDVKAGTIDNGYRNELKILLRNDHPTKTHLVEVGDRIAQLEIRDQPDDIEFVLAESVSTNTDRGLGGIGSTGR